ncbi:SKP1-like protein 11 [Cryptomeria japonica]|uniref:SKP1-like protein 11 n=1 Tax=Cryptomeria japonica TaxID=3369 RepID=UPI0027D9CF5D|nr:SKP1-like protein 11 [Cryptomeria japonica]
MAEQRKVRVRSSENQVVEVEKAVAFQSGIIKDVVDFAGIEAIIPLDGVEGSILAEAANYLGIKNLVELTCCEGIGGWMIGKSVEEILEAFHIVNDYSPEEEEALGSEASWAFD